MATNKTFFNAGQFSPTEFYTAEDKAKFANQLANFILQGCPRSKFQKQLYLHVSTHFNGHIAHYNLEGFYTAWFDTSEKIGRFVKRIEEHSACGQPAYTFCDVEKAMKTWLAENRNAVDEAILQRLSDEETSMRTERARVVALRDTPQQEFKVAAKSQNQGSFGHWGYIVCAKDGSSYELQRSGGGHLKQHAVGDVLTVRLQNGKPVWPPQEYEISRRIGNVPENILAEVWGEKAASA